MELLASLPEEERLNLLNGLRTCSPYSTDPVNLCTGNLTFEKEDIKVKGSFPLFIKRTYNSLDKRKGVFGSHWTHNYEICLIDKGEELEILKEDGCKETYFKKNNGFVAADGIINSLKKSFNSYILTSPEEEKYIFNLEEKCISTIDKNQNTTEYTYKNNKLYCVSNSSGKLYFKYDGEYLANIIDHTGRSIKYTYNECGLLKTVEDEKGNIYEYKYNSDGRVEEIINPEGIASVKNEFDVLGRTTKQIFPDGGVMSYQYED